MMKNSMKDGLDEFESNPFIGGRSEKVIDLDFLISLSKPAQNVIKYIIHKGIPEDGKLLFDIDDFSKFMGYKTRSSTNKGLLELCSKGLLAKTKFSLVYWVNNKSFNEGILCKEVMKCV